MRTLTRERIERVKAASTEAADADGAVRQRIIEGLERDDAEAAGMLRDLLRTYDDPEDDLFTQPVIRLEEVMGESGRMRQGLGTRCCETLRLAFAHG